jgi:hypothetical protein
MTKHVYELKYPHRGGRWHKVVADSAREARKKFTDGTTYKPTQVHLRRAKK